ncbi:NAD-dependent protein deacylase [Aneurinibacillus aneurinilyticus]|jgi:NAD-dependent deacetylase|uniref:protein acetyllysine N-acetyltransferase n=2 Tax=Aneurinibacillus aneurinilyticus TaxID=1391 RepID=U1X4F4_ANEAE|nr:NAD-dependent protein deacylase [Aneurinibacillus aneurinilyticus]ERI09845.1 putative NAD-dependent deacetylase [Aneurinibacillus aneurinilyticus ATCC 12856]MCI1695498.1 NAD-dependent protein deacylase [Aneurinibacillus aneurinilyticus]MED0672873.1 NAD-dependent protein deacylase [Aneurinibacillus aneurinilyticus]MED0708000.1 NAD-dependent protein deacylase [Aneurinibacillus aneurinilyticus]MED0722163.1 NAD-dependent protein deacylase [Aneurinibacillus aneurinilyticus]
MTEAESVEMLAQAIQKADRIVVLTGAGISTESGIPDFRSTEGIWTEDVSRMDMMSTSYLRRNPDRFWPAFKDIFRVKIEGEIKPNRGHYFLAALEETGKHITVVTQNVDGLHVAAGSGHVLEIHGTIKKAYCPSCVEQYDVSYVKEHEVPRCIKRLSGGICGQVLRPAVVLFGDPVEGLEDAFAAVENCDLFLTLGSSLEVTPVNYLPGAAASDAAKMTAIINREPTQMDKYFDIVLHAEIGPTLSCIAKRLSIHI